MTSQPISEADLHAWADERLAPARRAAVEAWLADHPDDHARVDDWRRDARLLRRALAQVAEQAMPPRLALPAPQSRLAPFAPMAALLLVAAVGAGVGWTARDRTAARSTIDAFAQRAAVAHVVYTPDMRRPVEVGAEQEQQLLTWLSKRLGDGVEAPALQPLGYRLVGGRLLPGEHHPVAQFMYEDAQAHRLTLYVSREVRADAAEPARFRFASAEGVHTFYWVDGRFGYAISAEADKTRLLEVAHAVHDQLDPPK